MNTKIIATIGPKSEDYKTLKTMVENGLDIIRLNFSHATYEQCHRIKDILTKIKKETGRKIEIMQDLQGPRMRIGILPHEIILKEGETYSFIYNAGSVDNFEIPIDDKDLYKDVKVDEPFYLSNGEIELKIIKIENKKIVATVERGGLLMSRKGINIPETTLNKSCLTPKDLADIEFGLNFGVDYMALSFVQSGADVKKLRKLIGDHKIKIIPKIERAIALEAIDEIIKLSDGIMIARGDLGIELPLEELPIIQKNLIRHAHWHHKPAIVATQMMTSMIEHHIPTRAEVSDIANAIFDGADALMLSDETAAGNYPTEAIKIMKRIVNRTDDYFNNRNYFNIASK
jgi:pyruvate kinase